MRDFPVPIFRRYAAVCLFNPSLNPTSQKGVAIINTYICTDAIQCDSTDGQAVAIKQYVSDKMHLFR